MIVFYFGLRLGQREGGQKMNLGKVKKTCKHFRKGIRSMK